MQQLQPNTILQGGKYRIERVLGQGGFGNTYVGYNTVFNERVAIKEFFIQGINDRDESTGSITISIERNKQQFQEQLEKFKKEALRIRKLDNPHIVKVHDLFEENGTAYYVMDYVDGENLAERLKRTGKPMSEQKVREILPQILDALKSVHDAGIWHLDLKPANIMLDKAGNIKLIDFGASKQLNAQKGGATSSTAITYTNGYAPREQMEQNYDKFGPWTDIYALGATLYNLLTYKRPPLPTDIDDDMSEDKHLALPFPEGVSDAMKYCVLRMMKTNRMQRPQNIDAIIAEILTKEPKTASTTQVTEQDSAAYNDEETIIAPPRPIKDGNVQKTIPKPLTDKHKKYNGCILFCTIISILLVISSVIGGVIFFNINNPKTEKRIKYDTAIGGCVYWGPVDENNIPHGRGIAKFDDGRTYSGGFNHGEITGKSAFFLYENGDKFTGEFRNNSFYYGKYTIYSDESYYIGYFKKGQPSNGKWYNKNGKIIENVRK